MRIGIDGRLWSESGNGRYLRNLITELAKLDKDNEYFIFLLEKDFQDNLPKNFHQVKANFGWYTVKEQILFPKILGKYKLDLVHFPHFNIPILYRGKFVVTIHDITHQKFKMKRASTHNALIYEIKHHSYNLAFRTAIKNSLKIITPSEYVKKELVEKCHVKQQKIVVTPEAAEENFLKLSAKVSSAKAGQILKKFSIKAPFIFYIGNAHPHKNVEGLIGAFQILRKKFPDLSLVLSGKDSYFWQKIKKGGLPEGVGFTGFISDQEYIALLKSATVYVQPSFEEGFGIPLLEAYSVGTPVVSSSAASLPEVGGTAALYFDPKNIEEMAGQIQKVINDQELREDLIKKGKERSKQFSWKKMAQQTLGVYREVS